MSLGNKMGEDKATQAAKAATVSAGAGNLLRECFASTHKALRSIRSTTLAGHGEAYLPFRTWEFQEEVPETTHHPLLP